MSKRSLEQKLRDYRAEIERLRGQRAVLREALHQIKKDPANAVGIAELAIRGTSGE